jgi:hypothetical protein
MASACQRVSMARSAAAGGEHDEIAPAEEPLVGCWID